MLRHRWLDVVRVEIDGRGITIHVEIDGCGRTIHDEIDGCGNVTDMWF